MFLLGVYLFVLGLIFGSFVNALVWRVHEQGKSKKYKEKSKKAGAATPELSIVKGRSICPNCKHVLAPADLVPVFSWLVLRGRCRYCQKPISPQYPLVELATGAVFLASYLWWPGGLNGAGSWVLFVTWLVSSVGLMALLVYDFRWMLLPNKILYPTAFVAATGRLVYIIGFEAHKAQALRQWALSIVIASGIFLLLYIASSGKWIGFGDVRLGLITGTLLASPAKSFLMIFTASLLGTLSVLPSLISKRMGFTSKLPYGPYLIVACVIGLFWGTSLIDWYKSLFLP